MTTPYEAEPGENWIAEADAKAEADSIYAYGAEVMRRKTGKTNPSDREIEAYFSRESSAVGGNEVTIRTQINDKSNAPWWKATAEKHAAADAACGRPWVCACGACRTARKVGK